MWAEHYLKLTKGTFTIGDGTTAPPPPDPGDTTLPLVTPAKAYQIRELYGVGGHANWRTGVYGDKRAWISRLAGMGIVYFRTGFNWGNDHCRLAVDLCREFGLKMVMVVPNEASDKPTNDTPSQMTQMVNDIAAHAWDVCYGIEGLNEPNQNRGTGGTTPGWQNVAYDLQVALYNATRSTTTRTVTGAYGGNTFTNAERLANAIVIGPSLHDTKAAANNGQHYKDLAATGIAAYMDYLGIHRYPGGKEPTNQLDQRLGLVEAAFGSYNPSTQEYGSVNPVKIILTEFGYTNALATTSGFNPVPEDVSDTYGPRSLMDLALDRKIPFLRYEALDDYDAGAKDEVQANFGLWRVSDQSATLALDPSTWSEKPEVGSVRAVLEDCTDPGGDYTPTQVRVKVETSVADVKYRVVGKRDGTAWVYIWREKRVWDTNTKTRITVPTTSVVVKDNQGSRTYNVGASVVKVTVRP